ncbi:MAG: hypothetical protein IT379_23490 [Deltaproteobacteria bacterium]|nr:hypothetical protein [Deltaproteobacteria bacterium]
MLTRKWVRRSIVLDDVPEGERPRALALAMAELLRASWAELAFADDPEAPPALVRSLDERLARVSRHARSDRAVTIRALAIGRFFPASPLFVAGGRLGVAFSLGAWSIHGGAIVAGGSRGTSIGEVFATAATGYLGGGLRWTEGRWARVTASIRGELGGVAASGQGRSDDVQSRDTGGLLALSAAEMSFELRLARAWSIALDVESGVVLAGISLLADGREAASLSGAFLGVSIGIVVAP